MGGAERRGCRGPKRLDESRRSASVRRTRRSGAAKPSTLSYWLASTPVSRLAERLRCDVRTAARLKVCGTPCVAHWRADVDAVALWLGLAPARLAPVLIEAEAASLVRTYPVTRGILAVAAASNSRA